MNSKKVEVTCGGTKFYFSTAQEAKSHFAECMFWCDPQSSEYSRYAYIVMELMCGRTCVNDQNMSNY